MESLFTFSSAAIVPPSVFLNSSSSSSSSSASASRLLRFPALSKKNGNDPDLRSDSLNPSDQNLLPVFSQDAAMGLVLSAASVRGWTTDSGMEGPVAPTDENSGNEKVSTFPWSLFTKSPRRRMRVAFTCNVCGQRTTRAINPHAYTDGTVFVQCCGCNVFHKLVDNLNLFHEMKCYVNPSFNYKEPRWDDDVGLKYLKVVDEEEEDDDDPSRNYPFPT